MPARVDASGKLNSLLDQDRSLWDQKADQRSLQLLELSAEGVTISFDVGKLRTGLEVIANHLGK